MATDTFRIRNYVLGMVGTNCYIVFDNATKKCVIVDPADHASFIYGKCEELGLTPEAILITHGHFDHIMAVNDLVQKYGIPVFAGKNEIDMLQDPSKNLSWSYDGKQISVKVDRSLKDGEIFTLIDREWKVLFTPGHTAGAVCYYIASEEVLISGDTLFYESVGRTDLPTGSGTDITNSIQSKLYVLPEDTMVYPGHGEVTTIGHEKKYNYIVRGRV